MVMEILLGMGMLVKKENLGFGDRSWRYAIINDKTLNIFLLNQTKKIMQMMTHTVKPHHKIYFSILKVIKESKMRNFLFVFTLLFATIFARDQIKIVGSSTVIHLQQLLQNDLVRLVDLKHQ